MESPLPTTQTPRNEIRIDCRGIKIGKPFVSVEVDGTTYKFIVDEQASEDRGFHAGIFADAACNHRDALAYPRSRRMALLLETPLHPCYDCVPLLQRRFDTILTHQEPLLNAGKPHRQFFFGTNWLSVWSSEDLTDLDASIPEKTRNLSFIGSIQHDSTGAYDFRREVAEYLLKQQDVDCFGKGIKPIEGKAVGIAPYRFSVCMENIASGYYFTEKLIDCMLLESIPVYYGSARTIEMLDPRGIIFFSSIEELAAKLPSLNSELYDTMRPHAIQNKKLFIENDLHTYPGLFRRLARQLPAELQNASLIKPQKWRSWSKAASLIERLTAKLVR